MLFISLLMNVPTVCLTQKVHTFPAQPGLTIAEQILGGAETVESLTLFPLQRREGLVGVGANFNFYNKCNYKRQSIYPKLQNRWLLVPVVKKHYKRLYKGNDMDNLG